MFERETDVSLQVVSGELCFFPLYVMDGISQHSTSSTIILDQFYLIAVMAVTVEAASRRYLLRPQHPLRLIPSNILLTAEDGGGAEVCIHLG
ncbi:MAG TPA: hypothetical protein VLG74_10905 [Blastocatellia bacterium]|nr:hypothetical protein [Blastocatellia bacterium]